MMVMIIQRQVNEILNKVNKESITVHEGVWIPIDPLKVNQEIIIISKQNYYIHKTKLKHEINHYSAITSKRVKMCKWGRREKKNG